MMRTMHFEGVYVPLTFYFALRTVLGFSLGVFFLVLFSIFILYAFIGAYGCIWNNLMILVIFVFFIYFLWIFLDALDDFIIFWYD